MSDTDGIEESLESFIERIRANTPAAITSNLKTKFDAIVTQQDHMEYWVGVWTNRLLNETDDNKKLRYRALLEQAEASVAMHRRLKD